MAKSTKRKPADPIIIDKTRNLIFDSEEDLYAHFAPDIAVLEKQFFEARTETDVRESEFTRYDGQLERLLDDPDEVWEETETLEGKRIFIYIRGFDKGVSHIAVCYLTENMPSFVYLHFPTRDEHLVEHYRRGQLAFERSVSDAPLGAIDGDALFENDELAVGLYKAMLLLRSERDIPEDDFPNYADCREETLGDADEIWRSGDSLGNVLVSFIKEFEDEEDLYYIVVTVEDAPSGSHALLFSFPTRDKGLVGRYRHGENLQADEVVQESSH